MDNITKEGSIFSFKDLTNLTNYEDSLPAPIELDSRDENFEGGMTLVTEKIDKLLADRACKEVVASLIWMTRTFLF